MTARFFLACCAMLVGCQSNAQPAERYVAPEAFSCDVPRAWSAHQERGSVMFTSDDHPRRTFAVRAVPRRDKQDDGAWLKATDVVMKGLPDVRLETTRSMAASLPATAYDLSFVPPGARERYTRTHAVLFGATHVFHVIETAPSGASTDDDLFATLLRSFREEG